MITFCMDCNTTTQLNQHGQCDACLSIAVLAGVVAIPTFQPLAVEHVAPRYSVAL